MSYKIIFAFFIAAVCASPLRAADSLAIERSFTQKIGDDITLFGEDMGAYFSAPLHFDQTDRVVATSAVYGTVVLFSLDRWAHDRARAASQSDAFQSFMNASRQYGEIVVAGGLTGAAYLGGIFFHEPWLRTTGRDLIEGLAYAGITTTALKIIVGRARPYNGNNMFSFSPLNLSDGFHSLPSGHSTVAFTLSTILSQRIDNIWASVLLYGAATCTGFSRMYNNEHWLSDVFLGAAIGTTTGLFVIHRDEERNAQKKSGAELQIIPTLNGLRAQVTF
jgi:membrane-associated phospholipid phosphatase